MEGGHQYCPSSLSNSTTILFDIAVNVDKHTVEEETR